MQAVAGLVRTAPGLGKSRVLRGWLSHSSFATFMLSDPSFRILRKGAPFVRKTSNARREAPCQVFLRMDVASHIHRREAGITTPLTPEHGWGSAPLNRASAFRRLGLPARVRGSCSSHSVHWRLQAPAFCVQGVTPTCSRGTPRLFAHRPPYPPPR